MRFHLVQKGKRHASTDEQHYRNKTKQFPLQKGKKEEEKNVNGFKRQHKMEKGNTVDFGSSGWLLFRLHHVTHSGKHSFTLSVRQLASCQKGPETQSKNEIVCIDYVVLYCVFFCCCSFACICFSFLSSICIFFFIKAKALTNREGLCYICQI